ncbi:hypothetical protein [Candidatus Nitrospira neomarina]|uniref:Uncharacterized protein n=1 Tax=Candidatus Nitrospira neomarina TaxID=3020899 RepID=A0AA96GKF2_9BACT|nr:hypothetical protein [Candidatus Nitrospira neomarina]WNM62627.1 hypothetical protein PQG83_02455 [Candidatus Nitrospira neomarina]
MSLPQAETRIDRYEVSAYKIPTDMSESDGTYTWDSTTLVVLRIGTRAGDREQILPPKIWEAAAKKELVVADGFSCREQIVQTTDGTLSIRLRFFKEK